MTRQTLSSAIIYGTLDEVATIVATGIDLNYIDEYGYTPLIQTAIMDNLDMAKLLIEQGALVNDRDLTGGSALYWAVENNNLAFCHLLLDHGADPNAYTDAGQPILAKVLLRRQKRLQTLLHQAGASYDFANDFIYAKLLGHRFELRGYVDIVNHKDQFVEIDLEGFFLEFTLGIMRHSLQDFRNNFSAKHLHHYFDSIQTLVDVLNVSTQLIKYEHYRTDIEANKTAIEDLLVAKPILLIPVSYEGHAIAFVKYGNLLAKCDRSRNDEFKSNVTIYRVTRPENLTTDFIKYLMYKRQYKKVIDVEIIEYLGLQTVVDLPIGFQITGNCSWANIEACIPVILFLSSMTSHDQPNDIERYKKFAMFFYQQWREWDKERSLHFCIRSFEQASPVRKASIASWLGAVMFQRCNADNKQDIERAVKIMRVLKTPGYEYVLKSYVEIYCYQHPSQAGENLRRLIGICESYL